MTAWSICLTAWLAGAAPAGPSVAVMPLDAEPGVSPTVLRLATDAVLQEVQRAGVFSQVLSYREVETVLGLEKQRQLLSCQEGSCVAELAGALGVDLVLGGALARLGKTQVLSLRLIRARSGVVAATVMRKTEDPRDEALLDAVAPLVRQVLTEGGLVKADAAAQSRGVSPLLPAGGAVAAGGVGVGVLGVLLALLGAAVVTLPVLVYVPTPGLPGDVRVRALPASGFTLLGIGAAGLALSLVVVGAGVLVAVLSAVVR